jgi:hypothetical protein
MSLCWKTDWRNRNRARAKTRRGLSVIVIMGLISISLALSYTVLRTQTTTAQLQTNSNLRVQAQQAAITGFSIALRKMHESAWPGIGSPVTGSLSPSQAYAVTFQTGDPALSTSDPDYPYRVTLVSTGSAVDLAHPTVAATSTVQAVVRLSPRQMPNEPTNWSAMTQNTVYQYAQDDFEVQLPCQVSGSLRLQGKLRLCDRYPSASNGLSRYLGDLNVMRFFGYPDYRPLTGPVSLPTSQTDSTTLGLLTTQLGVVATNVSTTSATGWNFPGMITTYQLYPGGQVYKATAVNATLSGLTLAANPQTNPLGIFYNNGNVVLSGNVSVQGTLLVGGGLTINGTGNVLQAASLPALVGSTAPVQLPAVIVNNDLVMNSASQTTIGGLVAVWGKFDVAPGTVATSLNMQGRLITKGFHLETRNEWVMNNGQWNSAWVQFNSQLAPPTSATIFFYPVYLGSANGLNPAPVLSIAPEASPVNYHWKDAANPLYVASSSDPGLRWTVVRWSAN